MSRRPPRPTIRRPDCGPSAPCASSPTGWSRCRWPTRGTAAGPGSRSPRRSASPGRQSTRSMLDREGIAEMFERFTEEARRVVVLAQEEARLARDPSIDGTHLLLGIAVTEGPGAQALQGAGVDLVGLRT